MLTVGLCVWGYRGEQDSPYRKLPHSEEESPSQGCEERWGLSLPIGEPSGRRCVSPTVSLTEDPVSRALLWLGFWWLSMVTVFHTGLGLAAVYIFEKSRCRLHPTCVVH